MTYRPKDTQERILHRLKIANGHLTKVISMMENHEYCVDIIHQSQAIQCALKEVDNLILENHLKTCVADSIKNGREEEAIAEVMNVFRKKD
ncbi:MAG: metal-sensing transcriptional repressor [Candidatus Daviesbacteria bacterium]|nr:metal-sensing transcriptional repressor [Candidatus Daviesbacteria bacterium]